MKKIGVLSDTHGTLDEKVIKFLAECDQVWHAGDIGNIDVLTDMKSLFPVVHAVYGNVDGWDLRSEVPEIDMFETEGRRIAIKHICGNPRRYDSSARKLIEEYKPDILVCGHSHILRVEYDKKHNLLFINPGAAGNSGFHKVKTAVRFVIDGKDLRDLEVLELPRKGHVGY